MDQELSVETIGRNASEEPERNGTARVCTSEEEPRKQEERQQGARTMGQQLERPVEERQEDLRPPLTCDKNAGS